MASTPKLQAMTAPGTRNLRLAWIKTDGTVDASQANVTIDLAALGTAAMAIQALADGSYVLASANFSGGAGAALYYFIGFAVPSSGPHGTGQQLLNASPNGTLQTLIVACPWNAAWTTSDHPISAQTKVYIALPEHLRDTIASELVPDLTGAATSGTVTYTGYTFTLQSAGAYFDQYRTATPPSGSGLPAETQYITIPYKVGDFIWAATSATNINVQVNSGDAITGATVAAGGTGYKVGDTISVSGGTGTPPTFTVASISGGGSSGPITGVTLVTVGSAFGGAVNPMAVTGGSGSGASLNMSYVLVTLRDTNVAARSWGD